MKILIGIHAFPPHVGGMEIVAKNQAKYLTSNANDVTVLTSSCSSLPGTTTEDGYIVMRMRALNFLEEKFGVPFPVFSPFFVWRAFRLVMTSDVVHVHDSFYMSSTVLAFWAKILRKPLFLTQHVEMIPHPNGLVMFVQRVIYKTTAAFIFKTSSKIIVYNQRVEKFLINRDVPGNKIVSIVNGVDFNMFKPASRPEKLALRKKHGLPLDKSIAIFVGRFVPKKGFYKLLKAGADNYCIVFVGGKKPKRKIDERHIFLGSFSQSETSEIYRAADLFILPSEGEGFPLSVQEAMASGLPIVTTDDNGYDVYKFDRSLVRLIQPSLENIKNNISDVVEDKRLRDRMSKYSLGYARKYFNWNGNAKAIIKLYEGSIK